MGVVHACNPQPELRQEVLRFEASLGYTVRLVSRKSA
jgi:hypothetical protein